VLQAFLKLKNLIKIAVKVSVLIKVKVGTVRVSKAGRVKDSDGNSITINSSLKRIRSRELITYIKVNCV